MATAQGLDIRKAGAMVRKKANGKVGSGSAKSNSMEGPRKRPRKELLNHRQMQALAKRERVWVLAILCERTASPKEISTELGEGLSQVSYHVRVLRECRLIVLDHKIPRRGATENFYRAVTPTLIPPGTWDRLPPAMRKGVSLDILQCFFDDALASMEAGIFDDPPGELSWTPLVLDSVGIDEFGKLTRAFLKSVLELQANASKRLPKATDETVDATAATVFLASFLSARSSEENKKASATKRR